MTQPSTALSSAPDRNAQMHHFLAQYGWGDASLHPLPGDASFRRYIRVRGKGRAAMLMDAPPDKEDVGPYVRVARFLRGGNYSAPQILAADEAQGFVLAEDLGDDLFSRVMAAGGEESKLYDAAIDLLAAWYNDGAHGKANSSVMLGDYDAETYMREVALFAEWYLPAALGDTKAQALHDEYRAIWQRIITAAALPSARFVHRDFHADNLLWIPQREGISRVGLLDFQDALWGHAAYDVVSLLEDARRDVPLALAERLLTRYVQATGQNADAFSDAYCMLGAQRNTKIIGIFVRLSRRDNKHAYLAHLPRVWRYLERDLKHPALEPLRTWLETHIPPALRGTLTVQG